MGLQRVDQCLHLLRRFDVALVFLVFYVIVEKNDAAYPAGLDMLYDGTAFVGAHTAEAEEQHLADFGLQGGRVVCGGAIVRRSFGLAGEKQGSEGQEEEGVFHVFWGIKLVKIGVSSSLQKSHCSMSKKIVN